MRGREELVKAWVKKAEGDINAAEACLKHTPACYDAVCFHAQQSAEKYLKAYLIFKGEETPRTHDLGFLVSLAAKIDTDFFQIIDLAEALTDYAVEVRYPLFEEPDEEEAQEALTMAKKIREFVRKKLFLEDG